MRKVARLNVQVDSALLNPANRDEMERRRFQACKFFSDEARPAAVAKALAVSRTTASRWYKQWREQGIKGVKKHPTPGRPSRMDKKELAARIREWLMNSPTHYGFSGKTWSTEKFSVMIQREFNVKYDRDHVGRIMNDLGFRRLYKKWRIPTESNPAPLTLMPEQPRV